MFPLQTLDCGNSIQENKTKKFAHFGLCSQSIQCNQNYTEKMGLKQSRKSSALHDVCEGERASQASQRSWIHVISEADRFQVIQ